MPKWNYYNEIDEYAAQWLRNLIEKGLIPDGEVDTRSIVDVRPDDLRGFKQAHFFAGIAGWSLALKIANWPTDRQIWTGSCPCQPFSVAGKGKGVGDERHLWPDFFRLIRSCRPETIMGEQVAGAAGYGWLDGVRFDLESENYTIEAVDIPACSVNAPHIRQRLYWVAHPSDIGTRRELGETSEQGGGALDTRTEGIRQGNWSCGSSGIDARNTVNLGNANAMRELQPQGSISNQCGWLGDTSSIDMGDAISEGLEGQPWNGNHGEEPGWLTQDEDGPVAKASGFNMANTNNTQWRQDITTRHDDHGQNAGWEESSSDHGECRQSNFWNDAIWLDGADGKKRRSKPGVRLLAYGVSARVGKLRALGNAISPPLAAEVIKAYMETKKPPS